ncbi:MAG: DUF1801 domain-containing protein [Planctomycetes bacterium]|nr:DUF1801 domain-containing protein [Planctomycetota bacterium]
MSTKTVEEYASNQGEFEDVVLALAALVRKFAPKAEEAIKWTQPVWSLNGPLCYMKAFKKYVNFGFWRGAELDDPKGLLEGTGKQMRHVRIESVKNIPTTALKNFIKQAIKLNQTEGDPSR